MSHLFAGRLFAAYPGGPIERAVLTALALHMKHDTPTRLVCPSVATLARLTGYSIRRVREALRALEVQEFIEVVGARTGGRAYTLAVRINVADLHSYPDRTKRARDNPARGAAFEGDNPAHDAAFSVPPERLASTGNPARDDTKPGTRAQINPAPGAAEQGEVRNKGFEQGVGANPHERVLPHAPSPSSRASARPMTGNGPKSPEQLEAERQRQLAEVRRLQAQQDQKPTAIATKPNEYDRARLRWEKRNARQQAPGDPDAETVH